MITAEAPGKLFIAGEYAVVEPGEPAILVAVDRFIRVSVVEVSSPAEHQVSAHVGAAIDAVEQLRKERGLEAKLYRIDSRSELENDHGTKFGLGSSAAVTVAVVRALSTLYSLNLELIEEFKVALLATISVSPKSSGGDLAASVFGGWIYYTSPNRELINRDRHALGVTAALSSHGWNSLSIEALADPVDLSLVVGWTKSPSSTELLVDQLGEAVNAGDLPSAHEHEQFLSQSREIVSAMRDSLASHTPAISGEMRKARKLLQELAASRAINIETDTLRALCDIAEAQGFAAKPSGAGGGDCGIVLASTSASVAELYAQWQDNEILPLGLSVYRSQSFLKGAR